MLAVIRSMTSGLAGAPPSPNMAAKPHIHRLTCVSIGISRAIRTPSPRLCKSAQYRSDPRRDRLRIEAKLFALLPDVLNPVKENVARMPLRIAPASSVRAVQQLAICGREIVGEDCIDRIHQRLRGLDDPQ